jgi:cytochrome c-type biogenesis protein CcmE
LTTSVETARAEAEAAVEAAPAPAAPATARFARPASKLAIFAAIAAVIVLLTLMLPTTAPGAKYTDVRAITASPAAYDGKVVAVVGGVQTGSVSVGQGIAFNLTDYTEESVSIRVVYDTMDANFGEGKKVLAEGVVHTEGGVAKLYATRISIGCPTDYRGQTPDA